MAITLLGTGFQQLYQIVVNTPDYRKPASTFMTRCQIMTALDIFLGVSAVVLGALAFVGILPIPPSMVEPFKYAAIIGGAVNTVAAIGMKGCAAKFQPHITVPLSA